MAKIYLVQIERNVDGEISFETIPCASKEKAKEKFQETKEETIGHQSFMDYPTYDKEDIETAEQDATDTEYFLKASSDDYHLYIKIEEKEIIE